MVSLQLRVYLPQAFAQATHLPQKAMPNGTYFQSAPSPSPSHSGVASPPLSSHQAHHTSNVLANTAQHHQSAPPPSEHGQEAATKLAEAIDDFLGDLEKKFKGISDEILTKLDDMAERCDRLEQEMLVRETGGNALDGMTAGGKG
jgi:hypothetical protein